MQLRALLFCVLLALSFVARSQLSNIIQVPRHVWSELQPEERDQITSRYVVDVVLPEAVGVIIDAQGVDKSDPGTTAGQQLGATFASAAYVDNAFKGSNWNYSAKNHLAVGLLGAFLGATADRAPSSSFHYRYSIQTLSNKIEYLDEHTSEPFRKSIGTCVQIPSLTHLNQDLCTETVDSLRKKTGILTRNYLSNKESKNFPLNSATSNANTPAQHITDPKNINLTRCKFGNSTPVLVDKNSCINAKGDVL